MSNSRVIALTKNYIAVIDSKHYRRVNKYKWHVHFSRGSKRKPGEPYARASIEGKKVYLHRFITGASLPLHVDHINNQTLDCRDDNLKVCTHQENSKNKKKAKKRVDILVCNPHIESVLSEESKTQGKENDS